MKDPQEDELQINVDFLRGSPDLSSKDYSDQVTND